MALEAVSPQVDEDEPIEETRVSGPLGAVAPDPELPSGGAEGAVGEVEVVALVDRAREGDAQAFAALYDKYVDRVYRFVVYRVQGDSALAEDITSEVFLRALRKIKGFTWQGRDVGAWFLTIARNLVLDHFKSGRARLEVLGIESPIGDDRVIDAEDAALSRLSTQDLYKAITRLGNEQQEVIYWRFLQGYSVAESAAAMGKTDGAIKALQYRAVKALYKLVVVGEDA
ncbi:MAG TPA: sigma-70 family RNA polymerase sigma factor [Actinomycetota bacterium]|nr:sigma-70 family RNA polymerase sigma factor [Actinomycetota bacterium]